MLLLLIFIFILLLTPAKATIILDNDGGGNWKFYVSFKLTPIREQYSVYKIVIDNEKWKVFSVDGKLLVQGQISPLLFWNIVKSDGSDIRVFNHETQLYFWIEKFDYNNKYAIIWVNVTPNSKELNVAFGNPKASKSTYCNPGKTFMFFDDFNTFDSSKWVTNTNTFSIQDSIIKFWGDWDGNNLYFNTKQKFVSPVVIIGRWKLSEINVNIDLFVGFRTTQSGVFSKNGYDCVYDGVTTSDCYSQKHIRKPGTCLKAGGKVTDTNWHKFRIIFKSNEIRFWDDLLGEISVSNEGLPEFYLSIGADPTYSSSWFGYIDYIFVIKLSNSFLFDPPVLMPILIEHNNTTTIYTIVKVINEITFEPIQGLKVISYDSNFKEYSTVETNENGEAIIEVPLSGYIKAVDPATGVHRVVAAKTSIITTIYFPSNAILIEFNILDTTGRFDEGEAVILKIINETLTEIDRKKITFNYKTEHWLEVGEQYLIYITNKFRSEMRFVGYFSSAQPKSVTVILADTPATLQIGEIVDYNLTKQDNKIILTYKITKGEPVKIEFTIYNSTGIVFKGESQEKNGSFVFKNATDEEYIVEFKVITTEGEYFAKHVIAGAKATSIHIQAPQWLLNMLFGGLCIFTALTLGKKSIPVALLLSSAMCCIFTVLNLLSLPIVVIATLMVITALSFFSHKRGG